ncbi:hypothetical protein HDF22_000089 [Mucilaginibacter lappiensis]|uniref:Uncharacterized protein n=1 Tax=Mucilaginibacter lappiensis TaxID=354630 RepID=A0A841JBN2_9SPHI|nr:hypothetical protein [Mucilaginibacter lappiensis]
MLTMKSVNHVNPLFITGVNPTQDYISIRDGVSGLIK